MSAAALPVGSASPLAKPAQERTALGDEDHGHMRATAPPSRTGSRRQRLRKLLWLALVVNAAQAQPQPTLHDAFEQAWQRQPQAQAQGYRAAELAARAGAARAWLPSPPSLGLRERSDRLHRNAGAHEVEAELSVPLWLPGQRGRESALVDAEAGLQRGTLDAARWKLAGEVREAYWQARLAEAEHAAALRRLSDASALAADVQRREQAGDLARTDFNLAKGAEYSARRDADEAGLRRRRSALVFTTLTGLQALPAGDETPATMPAPLNDHPALRQLDRSAAAADARLRLAATTTRDNPEFSLSVRRERSSGVEAYAGAVTVGIRIPFSSDTRNEPRIAAANAEFIEARTAHARLLDQVQAEVEAARMEWQQAVAAVKLAEERQRLAVDNDRLLDTAFSVGEIDLATRLRAAAERHGADADVARTRLEAGRAAALLNQALGVLP